MDLKVFSYAALCGFMIIRTAALFLSKQKCLNSVAYLQQRHRESYLSLQRSEKTSLGSPVQEVLKLLHGNCHI
jgi:hypothetical protein